MTVPGSELGICGIDEVGRGALAGPLVAAAVVLPEEYELLLGGSVGLLRDSKTLTRLQRDRMSVLIRRIATEFQIAVIEVGEIDARGISWANREAFRRLILALDAIEYVVDGRLLPRDVGDRAARVRCQVRADSTVPQVAAASIVAKVVRDDLMRDLGERCPEYGWSTNAGYGTPQHILTLQRLGVTPHHRSVFVATALRNASMRRGADGEQSS